jgi:ferric-dicitrate binding protein FerR (iron transport regulator)
MSGAGPDRPEEDADLVRWIDRVREGYAPPPASPAQRAAFDARLRERLAAPPRRTAWLPLSVGAGLATAALTAALAFWPEPGARAPERVAAAQDDWAGDLLLEDGSAYGDAEEPEDALPPQYAAIASVWLE